MPKLSAHYTSKTKCYVRGESRNVERKRNSKETGKYPDHCWEEWVLQKEFKARIAGTELTGF